MSTDAARNPKRRRLLRPPRRPSPDRNPYPSFASPTPEQCLAVRDSLLASDGFPLEFAEFRRARLSPSSTPTATGESVLDGLILTLLSQNTTEVNARRAFESLKAAFPSWDQVVDAERQCLENSIRCAGLATTKAARIRSILMLVREKRGKICLDYLRGLSIDEVKEELSEFKGIGPKTVACVLMFYLQQDDFPVDTHVLKITRSIGWVPAAASREKAYHHLNGKIPGHLKFDLNCLFVAHGKLCGACSAKSNRRHSKNSEAHCPLSSYSSAAEPA